MTAEFTETDGSSYITASTQSEAVNISRICPGCAFRGLCDGMNVEIRQAKIVTVGVSQGDIEFLKNDAPCL